FSQSYREEERFRSPRIARHAALFRHDRIGEKTRAVDVEGTEKHGSGDCIRWRVCKHETKRDGAVKGEIKHDVEIAADVGPAIDLRNCPVQPIGQPAQEQEHKTEPELPEPDSECRRQSDCEAGKRHSVSRNAGARYRL